MLEIEQLGERRMIKKTARVELLLPCKIVLIFLYNNYTNSLNTYLFQLFTMDVLPALLHCRFSAGASEAAV